MTNLISSTCCPTGSTIQHGSSTTGLIDPPQGEWILVENKKKRNKKVNNISKNKNKNKMNVRPKVSVAKSTSSVSAPRGHITTTHKKNKTIVTEAKATHHHQGLYAVKIIQPNLVGCHCQKNKVIKPKRNKTSTLKHQMNHKGNRYLNKHLSRPKGKYPLKVLKKHQRKMKTPMCSQQQLPTRDIKIKTYFPRHLNIFNTNSILYPAFLLQALSALTHKS